MSSSSVAGAKRTYPCGHVDTFELVLPMSLAYTVQEHLVENALKAIPAACPVCAREDAARRASAPRSTRNWIQRLAFWS